MPYIWEWFPPLWVGVLFTVVGGLKLYGLYKGIEGGASKPFFTRLMAARCANLRCRIPYYHILLPVTFLVIGIIGLIGFFRVIM